MSKVYTLTLYPTAEGIRGIISLWLDENLDCELTIGKRGGERFVTVAYTDTTAINRILKTAKGSIVTITH